ncbi:MAG: GGDEF domain-containing protein [Desulfomonile sp.]|nr:GGDEF domain-containing protein [Desulfomonile sp.]
MSEITIFEDEEKALREAETILASSLPEDEPWASYYKDLVIRYRKLLRHTKQLVKMGDAMQSELARARDAAEFQATRDFLTLLWNRSAILGILKAEIARSQRENRPLSLIIGDVDYFKKVNDEYGHLVGDAVLREISERLKSSIRTYDQVGRFGGEEFIIVAPGCASDDAVELGERVRAVIAENPVYTSEGPLSVTMSFGVATYGCAATADVDSLIRAADEALYRAKREGRNRVAG